MVGPFSEAYILLSVWGTAFVYHHAPKMKIQSSNQFQVLLCISNILNMIFFNRIAQIGGNHVEVI